MYYKEIESYITFIKDDNIKSFIYDVYKILDSFIREIQKYREYTDGEFDWN